MLYMSVLVGVCKLNKLQNVRCSDKDKVKMKWQVTAAHFSISTSPNVWQSRLF